MLAGLVLLQQAEGIPSFAPLLVVVALAALVPLVLGRLKVLSVPVIVGEILAGIAFGESGLGLIRESDYLTFLANLGFVYLMFLAGLEINFGGLRKGGAVGDVRRGGKLANPFVLGFSVFAGTVLLAFLVSLLLGGAGLIENPFIMSLILSTTSVGVVVPALKDAGIIARPFGQGVLLSALIADFSTLLLITAALAAAGEGLSPKLLLIGALFVAFLGVWRVGEGLRRGRWRGIVQTPRAMSAEVLVRLTFALVIFFVVLSEWVGAEVILGAFLAGAAVSLISHHQSRVFEEKLGAIGFGFLVPIFFIHTGANFDLARIIGSPEGLVLVPILLLAAYAVKLLPTTLLFGRVYGLRAGLSAGVLLSSRLSLIIAAAAIGAQVGAVSDTVAAAAVLVAVVTCTFSPILFTKLSPPEAAATLQNVPKAGET